MKIKRRAKDSCKMDAFTEGKRATKIDENVKMNKIPFSMIFVRHAQSEFKPEMARLGTFDLSLTPLGIEQSEKSAVEIKRIVLIQKLQNIVGENYRNVRIISSPLKRTKETAKVIKKELGIEREIHYLDRLKEFHFGDFVDGKLVGMEDRKDFSKRTAKALSEIEELRKDDFFFPIIVSHGKVWKYMWNITRKLSFAESCYLDKRSQQIFYIREEMKKYDYSHSNM